MDVLEKLMIIRSHHTKPPPYQSGLFKSSLHAAIWIVGHSNMSPKQQRHLCLSFYFFYDSNPRMVCTPISEMDRHDC